ncbi:hypothetical protein Btru_057499 [Bulinus truncatus]|nr:hypothetical protein Btru_057499 [Bulinus truncatus]
MPETSLDSGKLLIVAAQFHHAGLYTCVVKSVAGTLSDSAYVTVRGPPGEPAGVQARKRNDANSQDYNNVAIWWQDGEVHGYPITKYTIHYLSVDDNKWRTLIEDIPASHTVFNVSPEWRKYDVTGGLSPGTAYQFRVIAGSTSLRYGTPQAQAKTKQLTQTEFNTVVGVQYYYTPYEVKVQAINDVGFGPKSTVTIVYSAEDMPTNVMPIYDTFEVINGTAAVVFWKPVPNTREAARGTVYAYQEIMRLTTGKSPQTLGLGLNEREALFNRVTMEMSGVDSSLEWSLKVITASTSSLLTTTSWDPNRQL